MKKILFFISILSTLNSNAQTSINVVGETDDVSGTVIMKNITPNDPGLVATGWIEEDFDMHNNTGTSNIWRITRRIMYAPSDWTDAVCWGVNCNDASGEIWATPNNATIADNSSGQMMVHITPNVNATGIGLYRYYITHNGVYLDSVDLLINFSVGIDDLKANHLFSIHPNPANDNMTISITNNENTTVKIVDLLGNIIYTADLLGTKEIDVKSFNNGMYIVQTLQNDEIISNQKLLIQH